MAEQDSPQIYLSTPPEFELSNFPDRLASVLDSHDIACLRLNLVTTDEDRIARAADVLRETAHQRDVAIVIESHVDIAQKLGLDGVHLVDGARSVRAVRKTLGPDAIVGAFCKNSRHEGMTAGEAGADYVAFGPIGETSLGDGSRAELDLFQWWSDMIEIPVVAEGSITADLWESFAEVTDFFAISDEIWRAEDAAKALTALMRGSD